MYLNEDWRLTDVCDKFCSKKLRCRGVLSSSKKAAREEKQQRRHLVCRNVAALDKM